MPDIGQVLYFNRERVIVTLEKIRQLLSTNVKVRKSIIKLFIPMMRPKLLQLENAFLPGLMDITWTSMKIPRFFEHCSETIEQVERFIKEVLLLFLFITK